MNCDNVKTEIKRRDLWWEKGGGVEEWLRSTDILSSRSEGVRRHYQELMEESSRTM